MNRLVELLIAWRWPLLLLAALLAAICWPAATELRFDQSIENMFSPRDPLLGPYGRFKATFGENEVVLAAYVDEQLLTSDGLNRLEAVTEELANIEGVALTQSLADPLLKGFALSTDPAGKAVLEVFTGYLIGSDRNTAAIICLLEPASKVAGSTAPRASTIDAMREVITRYDRSGVLAGEPVMLVDGFRYLEQDGRLLGWTSTALLVVVMLLCFRSIRWVIVPIAVVQLTLLWTQATLVWSGFELSMVSSMLSAIITIIGVATVVHLIVGFRSAREDGHHAPAALLIAGSMLAWPIIGACATDSVGFGSLLLASVGPIQDFGIMMSVGSVLVLGVVALLVPGLTLLGQHDERNTAANGWGERRLKQGLLQSAQSVSAHPGGWGLATMVISGLAAWGCLYLSVETDFTKNFRANSPVVTSYDFVERRLGGAGVWDIVLPAPEKLDWDYLARVRRLEHRLRDEVVVADADGRMRPGLTKVLSLGDVIEGIIGQHENTFLGSQVLSQYLNVMNDKAPELVESFYRPSAAAPGEHVYRVMLRAYERQTSGQKKSIIAQVEKIVQEEFPGGEATGFFVLLTYLIDSMTADQWVTFGAASAGIWVMMLIAFRSLRLAFVALVPNALPIFMVTGLMGWLGLKINMGAAMIAAVSMGLSVDSSIHYITAFRRLRAQGLSLQQSLEGVQQSVGRAMVLSTLALIVGFSALCLSEFIPTVYFGSLVSLAMLGGLAGNLVVLPLLLTLTDPHKRSVVHPASQSLPS